MTQIRTLKLSNIQSHKNTEIHFESGLNCIIGESSVGKSTIVRSLNWILKGESIDTMITWGETECSATIVFDNGTIVSRYRIDKLNKYVLIENGITQEYTNFGLEVPEPIKKVIGCVDIQIDVDKKINLNIRSQHDSLFLLGDGYSGTTRAKALNSLAGVHFIDGAMRSVSADLKTQASERTKLLVEVETLTTQIKEFEDLPLQEERLLKSKELFDKATTKLNTLNTLLALKKSLDSYSERSSLIALKRSNIGKFDLKQVQGILTRLEALLGSHKASTALSSRLDNQATRYDLFIARKAKVGKVDTARFETLLSNCTAKLHKHNQYQNLATQMHQLSIRKDAWGIKNAKLLSIPKEKIKILNDLIDKYKVSSNMQSKMTLFNSRAVTLHDKIAICHEDKSKRYTELSNMIHENNVCPTCHSTLDPDKIVSMMGRV